MSSTRFELPYQTVIDPSGVPIPDAMLFFYESGTSNPQDTYSDSSLTVANTNPVVANAGGRFGNIFLQPQNYKVVLTDSLGNQIWTADPVFGVSIPVSTRQVFTVGSGTYFTPVGCRQILVRMIAGGGGGAGTGTSGNTSGAKGGDTSFNGITALGGNGGSNSVTGGLGGNSGSGAASFRLAGTPGGMGGTLVVGASSAQPYGGQGGGQGGGLGSPAFGVGGPGLPGTGGGGGGAGAAAQTFTDLTTWQIAGGGGEGEYVELLINAPAASYPYSLGLGGLAGNPGTSGLHGGAGAGGYVIIEEYY